MASARHSFPELLQAFLQNLSISRTRSKHTLTNAKSVLSKFVRYLDCQGITQTKAITEPIITGFLETFTDPSYRYSAIYFLRLYLDYLGLQPNPARESIKLPKINPSKRVKFIESDALSRLLSVLHQHIQEGRHLREYALVQLILFTGMRPNEALVLRKDDILANGQVLIRDSKTHTSRVASMPDHVRMAIDSYHTHHPNPASPFVFYGHGLQSRIEKQLSYTTARTQFTLLLREAGIHQPGINLHALRHTFARSLVLAGFRREEIQGLLGHKSIKTTEIYTRLFDRDILSASPRVVKAVMEYTQSTEGTTKKKEEPR